MNVKFHKNCENAEILEISLIRCNFVKFDILIYFLGLL